MCSISSEMGRVLGVRWIVLSSRIVRAVWICFPALHAQFVQPTGDYTFDSKKRAQYRGMADKLEPTVSLRIVAVMLDELANLSES